MDFKNLKITAHISNAVALIEPLRLDCILSAAKAKEIMQEDYYTSCKQAGQAELVIETLSKFLKYSNGIFHASFGFFADDKEFSISYSKRWNGINDELVKFRGKGKQEIDTARGEFKSYHNNLIYKTTDKIVFYACGDKKKISQLLNGYISFVGKKSSQGFGSVTKWTIEEIEEDYSFVKNGIPMRYIPLTLVEKLGIDSSSNQLYSKEVALIPPSYRNNCRDICIYA